MESTTDFLDELAELALGSRLKRLADRMQAEATQTYEAFGHDAQPKWFGLLALLYRHGPASVVGAAERLGVTQPAVSQFCRGLEARGWINIGIDQTDARKRILRLSKQGRSTVRAMQPMWRAVDGAAQQLCRESGVDFLHSIQRFEQALDQRSLADRALEQAHEHRISRR